MAHIEFLGSREGILKAKMEIREGMKDGSPLILNGDDDLLGQFRDDRLRIVTYGIDNKGCSICAEDIAETDGQTSFTICCGEKRLPAIIPTFGRHNVYNALAAYAVGCEFGMADETIVRALKNYAPSGMRQRVVKHHGFTVVEDCYNCGPDALKAATEAFGSMSCTGRKYLVLGDMLSLGDLSEKAHYDSGAFAVEKGIDAVYCIGALCKNTWKGAKEADGNACHFDSKEEMAKALIAQIKPGDILWFKASHSIHLEDVIKIIYEEC